MQPVDDNDLRVTWFEFIFLAIANTLLMILNNLVGIVMFPIIGALGGWLLGLTPVGAWIAGGLKLVHLEAQAGDIYKVGALLGFIRSFLVKEKSRSKTERYMLGKKGRFKKSALSNLITERSLYQ
jgi:hypothetical protein